MTIPLRDVEKRAILEALVDAKFNVHEAARRLEVSPGHVYGNLRRWGLTPPLLKGGPRPVMHREYLQRCDDIRKQLEELKGGQL